ncbi:MAG: carbohydrate ABC transporter permease [Bacillota bacterium]|nr:carbohydrate ABC transporter permease [Bacillota bacterium]
MASSNSTIITINKRKIDPFQVFLMVILVMITFAIVYPFYNAVVLSLNDGMDARYNGPVYFWPRVFTLDNYAKVFSTPIFLIAARNTVARTILGTVLSLFVTAMFSYALIHKEVKFRKFYIIFALVTMYFRGGLIPTFLAYRNLGLYNNFLVYIMPWALNMFYVLISMTFFRAIPKDLEESAFLDGANEFQIFLRIIIPVSTPLLAALAIYVGVFHWNQWFDSMIYTNDENLEVLALQFAKMVLNQRYLENAAELEGVDVESMLSAGGATSMSLQVASLAITTFPIMVIYPFLQKYFVKGIMLGSVKE